MASKMMRIAARGIDGLSKAIKSNLRGELVVSDNIFYIVDETELAGITDHAKGDTAVAVNEGADMQVWIYNGTAWKEL